QAEAVGAVLERDLPGLALPPPRADLVEEIREDPPVPILVLATRKRSWSYWEPRSKDWDERIDLALLSYAYGGMLVDPDDTRKELRTLEAGRIVVRRRNRAAEHAAHKRLETYGLQQIETFKAVGGDSGRLAFCFAEG